MGFVHPQGTIHTFDLIYSMLSMLSKVQVTIRPSTTKTPSVETWSPLAHKGNKWLFDGSRTIPVRGSCTGTVIYRLPRVTLLDVPHLVISIGI